MNIENLNRLIDVIRDEDNFFNMYEFTVTEGLLKVAGVRPESAPTCGTPACIAGWAAHLHKQDTGEDWTEYRAACMFLDINIDGLDGEFTFIANELFMPTIAVPEGDIPAYWWVDITREQAIKTLEIFRDTGVVDWSHVDFSDREAKEP